MNEEDSTEENSQSEKYCFCKKDYDQSEFYIQCDSCDSWFHGNCVSITELETEILQHWYCNQCIQEKNLKIQYNPKCKREICLNKIKNDFSSHYCSEECALKVANERLKQFITKLPIKSKSRKTFDLTLQQEQYYHLQKLINNRLVREKLIRLLEKRQILIDECIEAAYQFNDSNEYFTVGSRICGFDQRIFKDWAIELDIGMYLELFDNNKDDVSLTTFLNELLKEKYDSLNTSASTTDKYLENEYICTVQGRCSLHDGWDILKAAEVASELEEQIGYYCKEMELETYLKNTFKKAE